jgi:outer membrane protein OmpA-like peptidoglycan-associated protein
VNIYSNIVILDTPVLCAGDLLPTHGRTTCSLAPLVSQAWLPANVSLSVVSSRSLFTQQQASGLNRSRAFVTIPRATPVAISDPPFLRHPIQFGLNNLDLTVAGRNILKRAAAWLRQHRAARILIVGSCHSGGSETCTRALAEALAAEVKNFLENSGVDSDQIVGVKGWNNPAQNCQTSDIECQQFNSSARIFMASSVSP